MEKENTKMKMVREKNKNKQKYNRKRKTEHREGNKIRREENVIKKERYGKNEEDKECVLTMRKEGKINMEREKK